MQDDGAREAHAFPRKQWCAVCCRSFHCSHSRIKHLRSVRINGHNNAEQICEYYHMFRAPRHYRPPFPLFFHLLLFFRSSESSRFVLPFAASRHNSPFISKICCVCVDLESSFVRISPRTVLAGLFAPLCVRSPSDTEVRSSFYLPPLNDFIACSSSRSACLSSHFPLHRLDAVGRSRDAEMPSDAIIA